MRQKGVLRSAWTTLGRLAARRFLVVALSGVAVFLGCMTIGQLRERDPVPEIHDERAYLLAGDTFAHGRLTNPPHPLWTSLETFQALQRPTYQAKYPPGQGLFLAAGEAFWGRPIAGVWLSAAVMVSALAWMLQGWLPARWALLGTALGAVTMVFSGYGNDGGALAYWSQSYWGGAGAALGGALLFGGAARVTKHPAWEAGLGLGAGAAVLALTRPYEGLIAALAAGVIAGFLLLRARPLRARQVAGVAVPAMLIVAGAIAWLGFYNARVTGSAMRFPYAEYDRQYEMAPLWRWQAPREEPRGLSPPMRDMARWGIANARWSSDPWNRARSLYKTLAFDAGPVLAPAVLVLLPWTLRSRRNRMATGAVAAVTAGTLLVNFFQSHYLAPVAPLVVLLMAASLRRLALLRFGGGGTGAAIGAVLLGATVLNAAREWVVEARAPERMTAHWAASREQIAEALAQAGGGHVVFVRYGPHHNRHMEVVFNGAGVDGAPVVWVRDLGPEQNGVVLRYFPDRVAWLLNIENDLAPARLVPYPSGGSAVRGRSPAGSD